MGELREEIDMKNDRRPSEQTKKARPHVEDE